VVEGRKGERVERRVGREGRKGERVERDNMSCYGKDNNS